MESDSNVPQSPVTFRAHRPGDMSFIVFRHAVIYTEDLGIPARFEADVGRIAADFIINHNPNMERCWIAERDGEFLGSVTLMKDKDSEETAKLRLLFVELKARGLGLGKQLVQKCIDFARDAGYKRIILTAMIRSASAGRLYKSIGFKVLSADVEKNWDNEPYETWELHI